MKILNKLLNQFVSKKNQTTKQKYDNKPKFDKPSYSDITEARANHFRSLLLPVKGKKVIDVGCGIGRLSEMFDEQGCDVLCVDGRVDNINVLKKIYPRRKAVVLDIESDDFASLGSFDIVFCYGLLYHLSDPLGFIKKAYMVCNDMMIIETCVLDSERPEVILVEEDQSSETQTLHRFGCRPSPGYIINCIQLAGFKHIYLPKKMPEHIEFQYKKSNDHSYIKNGNLIRGIYIASNREINSDAIFKYNE